MSAAAVRARGWGWRHAGRGRFAVDGLDLDIAPGERVLLLGASGAGKSTLLRGLAGVLGGDEDGEERGELTVGDRPASRARGVAGLVLQDPDSQVVLARVGDDVAFGCENLGVAADEIWPRVGDALDAVGLRVGLEHATSALSGGQKQRLALAGALAMRPGLLLLDEPTANLDPAGVVEVRDAVIAAVAATGATLVVVEHRVDVWAAHVDRVVVLAAGGGVLADGAPDTVFRTHGDVLAETGVWVPGRHPHPALTAAADAASPALLSTHGLAVGRRPFGAREAVVAASGIALAARAGRVLAVTGPNGVGKSTLALTVAGLLAPAAGAVVASDELRAAGRATIGPDPLRWRSRELLTRIGTVFQSPDHQLAARTVRGELEIGPRALRLPPAEVAARVDPLLEEMGMSRLAAVNPFTLSGGEKRRLTVAAALATRPRVLVLDEPTFGQDARTWEQLVRLLGDLRAAGTAIVTVTHDEALVAQLADDVVALGAAASAPGGVG
ncbi:MAG: ATP-binding cassette domain-containing protein [Microbacterium ginsengisoli]|mgnify:CR=1 FL=1|uniref:ABC transporter ATP-binding protein n=2 Tax=Microbacteriaceae TaxID=85023 RepID=UPI000A598604|nr:MULTISPECIES: ATP-binding cassette domain-containing protein [unclassified Microbacterium]MBN9197933.1 ATP-binding cassette domain-containing protein [Microbacterium ginsengisoli]